MVLVPLVLIGVGLAIVVFGADEAIKRLVNLARFLRLSEFTTSFVIAGIIAVLPELSIGVLAALEGTSSLGYGVILGANVADLTLVIGVVVFVAGKLPFDSSVIKNVRLSFLSVLLPVFLFVDGNISRTDGILLVLVYLLYLFSVLRTKPEEQAITGKRPKMRFLVELLVLVVSLTILLIGGSLITDNSQALSIALALPLFVIGTIVAVGTCLPEMTFAIRASKKQHGELGLGNILGNVLADSLLTIGVIALIQPIAPAFTTPPLLTGFFMAASALVVYILSRDGVLDRKDGAILIAMYAVFIIMQSIIS